jgi:hypothetical protein
MGMDDEAAETNQTNLPCFVGAGDLIYIMVGYLQESIGAFPAGWGSFVFLNVSRNIWWPYAPSWWGIPAIYGIISPPTGATASGACAEWIVETPNLVWTPLVIPSLLSFHTSGPLFSLRAVANTANNVNSDLNNNATIWIGQTQRAIMKPLRLSLAAHH